MMHCTMDDLVALRANEASAWARRHVGDCPACRAELDALYQRVAGLKALPSLAPARDRWPAIRDAARVMERGRRRRWGAAGLAAAAVVAALIVFRPFWSRQADAAELARVKQESASLEAALQSYDPDDRVMSGRSAALVADLQDHIAVVDGELARLGTPEAQVRPDELVKLWQERVNLMQQLVTVHVTRTSYVGL